MVSNLAGTEPIVYLMNAAEVVPLINEPATDFPF
jgi:hypothetical protein